MYRKFIVLSLIFSVMATSLFSQEKKEVAVLYPSFGRVVPFLGSALKKKNKDKESPYTYKMEGKKDLEKTMKKFDFLLLLMTKDKPNQEYIDFAKNNPDTSLLFWITPKNSQGSNSIEGVDGLTSASKKSIVMPFVLGDSIEKAIQARLK